MTDIARFDLFATRVQAFQLDTPALGRLAAHFVAERAQHPSVQRAVQGGWHGTPWAWGRDTDPVQTELEQWQRRRFARALELGDAAVLLGQSWATVLDAGGWVRPHDHAGAHYSSVLYLDAGDGEGGELVLMDPRGAVSGDLPLARDPGQFRLTPKTGLMVVFPAFLTHYVEPYRGSAPRVAVASNVRLSAAPAGR